jgi:hypothetical protein
VSSSLDDDFRNLLGVQKSQRNKEVIAVVHNALPAILETQPGFVQFDDFPGWFWIDTPRNRLVNVLRKIFAVTSRVHVSEVRSAIQRIGRLEGFAPPKRVLIGLAHQVEELEVNDDFICRKAGVSTEGWIEGTEATFFPFSRGQAGSWIECR